MKLGDGYMDRLVTFLDAKILPIANKLGSQRHMAAIRKGLIATDRKSVV